MHGNRIGHAGGRRLLSAADVPSVFAAGQQNDVPTVVGFTRDESANDLRTATSLDGYIAAARKLYGDRADEFLALYPAHDDAEAKRMGATAAREALVETGTRKWALAQRATGKAPFYMYMFARVHPFVADPKLFDHPQAIGAYHTSDVPYWFETQDALNLFHPTRDWTSLDRTLADKMSDCLIAFAKTGDPSTVRTAWPAWTKAAEAYVEFGDDVGLRTESIERLQFQSEADVTASTLRATRD